MCEVWQIIPYPPPFPTGGPNLMWPPNLLNYPETLASTSTLEPEYTARNIRPGSLMSKTMKLSIRFFNDWKVRAVWDEEHSKWWISVVDVVGILNEEEDYTKVRNYWKYLKTKLKKENSQLVSATNQLNVYSHQTALTIPQFHP